MNARSELIKLLKLDPAKKYSETEIEIEYESELAYMKVYEDWLRKLHDKMLLEAASAEKHTEVEPDGEAEIKFSSSDPSEIKIEELYFSRRCTNHLKKMGVNTLADCTKHTEAEFLAVSHIGKYNTDIIKETLAEFGLTCKQEAETEESVAVATETPAAETVKSDEIPDEADKKGGKTAEKEVRETAGTEKPAADEVPTVEPVAEPAATSAKKEPVAETVEDAPATQTHVGTRLNDGLDDDDDFSAPGADDEYGFNYDSSEDPSDPF